MTTAGTARLTPLVTTDLLRELESLVATAPGRPELEVFAPFTGQRIGTVPASLPGDISDAVDGARTVAREWARLPVRRRAGVLDRFHDLVIDNSSLAMDLIQLEAGKSRNVALEEVYDVAAVARYYRNEGPRLLATRRRSVATPLFTSAWEYRHPRGVVGFISPWNFPFTLAVSDMIPALVAGNGAVLKPDEKTPYSALFCLRLLIEAGLPPGLARVVTGIGEEVGPALIDSVDYVMFTGSSAVGRLVAERAGRNLTGSSLELGGKNAALVLADVDLDASIPAISRSVFANSGQLCVAMERIYVEEEVLEQFTSRFVSHVESLRMTTGFDFSSDLSAVIDAELVGKIQEHVDDAVSKGATLLTGGIGRPDVGPTFYAPTVLADVDETMLVCRNETFGPVVSIYPVSGVDEAVERANDSDLGLNFSVWTSDARRGVQIASRLQAGTVGVNDGYAAAWSTVDGPLGGWKSSGVARRHGAEGLLKYVEPQTVAVQRGIPAFAPFLGMAYPTLDKLLARLLKIVKHLPFYK